MAASHIQPTGYVENWQAGKTLAECNLRMFDSEDSRDVTFRVGSSGLVTKAHRYVLISRSCVFHAMFTGPMAEQSDVSALEIKPKHFRLFLLYLYTDNTNIDAYNDTALLYASRKYAITSLESKCLKFLKNNLSVDNACVIWEAAHHFHENHLYQEALYLVKKEGERSLKSSGFLTLIQVLVDRIVESDDLAAQEHVVFNAVNSWAEAECGRQGRERAPHARRSTFGDTLTKESSFLANEVEASGLLTDSERFKILDYSSNSGNDIQPFNTKQRPTFDKLPMYYVHRYETECHRD